MSSNRGPADGDVSDAYVQPTLAIRELRAYTSNIVGKVKTILDAAIVDPKQNKALKDLVHTQIWNETYTRVVEWAQAGGSLGGTFPFGLPSLEEE